MKSIIEDLFFGDLKFNIRSYNENNICDKLYETIEENENILTNVFEDNQKKLFLEFTNAQSEINANEIIDSFENGFEIGVKLMIETLILNNKKMFENK